MYHPPMLLWPLLTANVSDCAKLACEALVVKSTYWARLDVSDWIVSGTSGATVRLNVGFRVYAGALLLLNDIAPLRRESPFKLYWLAAVPACWLPTPNQSIIAGPTLWGFHPVCSCTQSVALFALPVTAPSYKLCAAGLSLSANQSGKRERSPVLISLTTLEISPTRPVTCLAKSPSPGRLKAVSRWNGMFHSLDVGWRGGYKCALRPGCTAFEILCLRSVSKDCSIILLLIRVSRFAHTTFSSTQDVLLRLGWLVFPDSRIKRGMADRNPGKPRSDQMRRLTF